ncbi:MAG: hypothetical protein LBU81_06520 [Methanosarcinales archaeon]|jgi:hypothetical protein|nr:hypothetical protein [Methanosarcinales archaeon]
MKKSILLTLAVLAAAVLAVGLSGCLSSGDEKTVVIENPAAIQTVNYYTIPVGSDTVTADIMVIIQGTRSQSVDEKNITATLIDKEIYVNVPVVNSSPVNTKDLGYVNVTVTLGTKDQFTDGGYKVIINNGTDKVFTSAIKFEDGQLYSFYQGARTIGGIVIGADGNNITATVNVSLSGSAESVDKENITTSGKFENGRYEISIPTQIRDGVSTLSMIYTQESFVIGQLDQLEDGTYTVSANGVEVTFTIENSQLVAAE